MMEPGLWKLAPAPVAKPWGLVHGEIHALTNVSVGVGELWLASAQTGPGNYSNTVVEPGLRRTVAELLDEAQAAGDGALEALIGSAPAAELRANPRRGKTEAWYIRAAIGRCGLAAGPRTPAQAERLHGVISAGPLPPHPEQWSDEVRELFGLIEPLQGGEMFYVPAGTLHTMFAIGPESRLIIDEIQQGYGQAMLPTLSKILMVQDDLLSVQVHPSDRTVVDAAEGRLQITQDLAANPTVRVYDFGRRPGEYPELGFSLVDTDAGLRRTRPARVTPAEGHAVEVLVADARLVKARVEIENGTSAPLLPEHGSYRVLHCMEGAALLRADGATMELRPGETVLVPARLEAGVRVHAAERCVLFDDAFPDLQAVEAFLRTHGAANADTAALLDPEPAI